MTLRFAFSINRTPKDREMLDLSLKSRLTLQEREALLKWWNKKVAEEEKILFQQPFEPLEGEILQQAVNIPA